MVDKQKMASKQEMLSNYIGAQGSKERLFSQRLLLHERVSYLKENVISWIAVKGE